MAIDDGGAAFPYELDHGMTLRDWFAGMAMQAMIGTYRQHLMQTEEEKAADLAGNTSFNRELAIDGGAGCEEIAADAFCFADAMIAARREMNG